MLWLVKYRRLNFIVMSGNFLFVLSLAEKWKQDYRIFESKPPEQTRMLRRGKTFSSDTKVSRLGKVIPNGHFFRMYEKFNNLIRVQMLPKHETSLETLKVTSNISWSQLCIGDIPADWLAALATSTGFSY